MTGRLRPVRSKETTQYYRNPVKTLRRRYILHIAQKDLPKFAKEIGTHLEHPEKRERIQNILARAR